MCLCVHTCVRAAHVGDIGWCVHMHVCVHTCTSEMKGTYVHFSVVCAHT